ncbi:Gustatory receptor 49b [Halyomorpha halys]|nr:Gustatory receptor 49b [Halyomorpha halys]
MRQHIMLHSGFNIIFTASTIMGIFPFRSIGNKLKLDKILLMYSVIITSFITSIYLFAIYISMVAWIHFNKRLFNGFLSLCFYASHATILLFTLFCLYHNRNTVIEIAHTFNILENNFQKMGLKTKKRYIQDMMLFEIFPPIVCCFVFYIQGNIIGSLLTGLSYTAMIFGIALCCCQFNILVYEVSEFLQLSSKFLKSIKPPVPFEKLIITEKLVDVVNQLVSTSCKINAIYSLPLLTTVLASYISIICHLFFIYENGNNGELRLHNVPADCLMLLYRSLVVWRLSHSAAVAHRKSKKFNVLLYKLMIEDKTNEFLRNDKLKLHIGMKREVVFTACGFFNLDYTLVHSVIASATTYLVISIQFGELLN